MKDWQVQQPHFSLQHNQFLPHMTMQYGTSATQQRGSGAPPFHDQRHYSQPASLQPQQGTPSLVPGTRTTSDHPSYYSQVSGTSLKKKYQERSELGGTDQSLQHTPSGVQGAEDSIDSTESSPHVSSPQVDTPSDKEEMRAFNQPDPLSFTTLDSSLPLTAIASDDTGSSNRPVQTQSANTLPADIARDQNSRSPVAISQVVHHSLPVHHPRKTSSGVLDSLRVEQQTGALSSDAINMSTTVEHGSVSSDNEHLYHLDTYFESNSTENIMAYLPIPEIGTETSQLPEVESAQSMSPRSDVGASMPHPWSLSPQIDAEGGTAHLGEAQSESHDSSVESQQDSDVLERVESFPDSEPPSTSPEHSGAVTQPTTSSSLSLQGMFLLKKQEFIQRSRSRVQQVEANARGQRIKAAQKPDGITHHTPRSGVRNRVAKSHTWEKSQAEYARPSDEGNSETATSHQRRAVSFSSPLLRSQQSGVFTPPMIHKGEHTLDPMLCSVTHVHTGRYCV